MFINSQLFGDALPPWYGETDLIDKISKVDEKINELFIIRAEYVETLKKSIQEKNNNK